MQVMAISKRQEGWGSSHMDYFFSVGLVTWHRHGPLLEPVPDAPGDGQEVNVSRSLLESQLAASNCFAVSICGLLAAIPLMASNNALMEPIAIRKADRCQVEWADDVLQLDLRTCRIGEKKRRAILHVC